ncbi:MAG TPA: hypothetical protein VFP58_12525 [Candidatus Eisenbacteria bacterium]|nr:hypothetical protein [Candidatus Eisenbacteria bacterium]
MRTRIRTGTTLAVLAAIPVALLVALPSPAAAGRTSKPKTWTWSFQADTLGREPQHAAVFGGRWEVALDGSAVAGSVPPAAPAAAAGAADSSASDSAVAASVPRVLRRAAAADDDGEEEFHYLQFKKPIVEDLIASVRFRIVSGDIDPTAGLLVQLDSKKGKNGYLLRVSGEKNRLIAHYLLHGKRRDLRHAEIPPLEPGVWHTLSIARKGSVMTASYDGVEKFRVRDERFRKGTVGLWTEDDTIVEFADLTVSTN